MRHQRVGSPHMAVKKAVAKIESGFDFLRGFAALTPAENAPMGVGG